MNDYQNIKQSPTFLPQTDEFLAAKFDTPDMLLIKAAIKESHASCHSSCVQGMHLVGEAGTGKSFIAKDYADEYPSYDDGMQRIVPVLYVSLPQKSTTLALMSRLLRTLTGLKQIKGKEEDIQARVIGRLEAAKTRLIFIDESQHLTRETSSVSAQHAADSIKALMDATGIPIICIGIDRSLDLLMGKARFKADEQLKRRNRRMYALNAYQCSTETWEGLMGLYQCELNCKVNLCSTEMLKRMHVATKGLFGNLTPLFKEAIQISGSPEEITIEVLIKAYIEFQPKNELTCNPFDTSISTVEMELTTLLTSETGDAA